MADPAEAMVRGERVEVIGPKPENWRGLGMHEPDAVLVRYPDGEYGAVRREELGPVDDG